MTGRLFWLILAGVCAFLMGALPIAVWRRKERNMRPVWMGMRGFFCFAVIAESFFQLICFTAPATAFLRRSPVRLIMFSCLCAGLFEECGRHWIYQNGLAAYRGRAVAVGYAIGHFSAEIVAFCLWPLISRPDAVFGAAEAALFLAERAAACAAESTGEY